MDPLRAALVEADPARKCELVAALSSGVASEPRDFSGIPGRPERPVLVDPKEVPHRGLGTVEGRAAMIHAVAHIEVNAINLALDAAYRFDGMPEAFHADWLSVAKDEARHFGLLAARLQSLGFCYGEFTAHNGLWDAAEKTAHDVLARMALVPRVLEARGLDVTPGIIHRFMGIGDRETAAVLQIILDEEVRHVALGTKWFRWLCTQRGVDPTTIFKQLLVEHRMKIRPPFNRDARAAAGFDAAELDAIGS